MESVAEMLKQLEGKMATHLNKLKSDLTTLRTGRANPQLIENIQIEQYGAYMPLKQVAAISVSEGRTLVINPWDKGTIHAIEKGLMKADLGATPVNDGNIIRLTLPNMSEDRRKEIVKALKGMAEDFKVKIRNERRDAVEKIKKGQKSGEIPEDEAKRHENHIQKQTDKFCADIDSATAAKEKDIMTI